MQAMPHRVSPKAANKIPVLDILLKRCPDNTFSTSVYRKKTFTGLYTEEQIMSKDKYPSIFSPQMETIVFIILQIFFATRAVLKIGEYSPVFAGEYSVK